MIAGEDVCWIVFPWVLGNRSRRWELLTAQAMRIGSSPWSGWFRAVESTLQAIG